MSKQIVTIIAEIVVIYFTAGLAAGAVGYFGLAADTAGALLTIANVANALALGVVLSGPCAELEPP
jgi:hypothetical protein